MKKKKITVTQKRWLVSAHILSMVVWFGTTVCFLILMIIATQTSDSRTLHIIYTLVETLDVSLIWPSSLASVTTGALIAILTPWGLFRFYWIVLKEVLSLLSIILGMIGLHPWLLYALTVTSAKEGSLVQAASLVVNQQKQFAGIIFQLIALTLMVVISLFKPWGQSRRPKRTASAQLAH
jgi:uncharacterized membrane protein